MIQHNTVKVCTKHTQYDRFFIIDQCGRKCHTHSRDGHRFSQFDMKIFIHDLCHDIQSAGRCIHIKLDAESEAYNQNIT